METGRERGKDKQNCSAVNSFLLSQPAFSSQPAEGSGAVFARGRCAPRLLPSLQALFPPEMPSAPCPLQIVQPSSSTRTPFISDTYLQPPCNVLLLLPPGNQGLSCSSLSVSSPFSGCSVGEVIDSEPLHPFHLYDLVVQTLNALSGCTDRKLF